MHDIPAEAMVDGVSLPFRQVCLVVSSSVQSRYFCLDGNSGIRIGLHRHNIAFSESRALQDSDSKPTRGFEVMKTCDFELSKNCNLGAFSANDCKCQHKLIAGPSSIPDA